MTPRLLFFLIAGTVLVSRSADGAPGIIQSFIRNNVAGRAENFKTQHWVFDPNVAYHWAVDYQKLNGIRAEDLIERLGLGEDGHAEERRAQQALRDRGEYVSRQPLHGP